MLVTLDVNEKKWTLFSQVSSQLPWIGFKYSAAVYLLPQRQILFCGGLIDYQSVNSACIIDIKSKFGKVTDSSKAIASLQTPRMMHSLVYYKNKVYALGGQADRETYLASVERWAGGDAWEAVADMNRPRSTFAAVATASGIYVAGGYRGSGQVEPSVEFFTEETGQWHLLELGIDMLAGSGAAELDARNVLILGGTGPEGTSKRVLRLDTEAKTVTEEQYTLVNPRSRPIVFKNCYKITVLGGTRTDSEQLIDGCFVPWISAPPFVPMDQLLTMPYVFDLNKA